MSELDDKIRAAARILREDRVHVKLGAIEARFNKHFPEEPNPDGNPTPPPVKGDDDKTKTDKPKSRWWGDSVPD